MVVILLILTSFLSMSCEYICIVRNYYETMFYRFLAQSPSQTYAKCANKSSEDISSFNNSNDSRIYERICLFCFVFLRFFCFFFSFCFNSPVLFMASPQPGTLLSWKISQSD